MGCSASQEVTIVENHVSLLGRCWEMSHVAGDKIEARWFPFSDSDNGQRPNFAFTVSTAELDDGTARAQSNNMQQPSGASTGASSSFLKKHHLAVYRGVDVKVHNSTSVESISSDSILQTTEKGYGGNVAVAGTMVSLGAEFSNVKSAGPGRRSIFTVVVVKVFELEIIPAHYKERNYQRHEVDTDVLKKKNREQFGEGVVTKVLYGGYLVIETEQENFAEMRSGIMARAQVGVSPGGGGQVGGNFARSKTEGAKATNSKVRRVGGDNKLIPSSFTNAAIEKVLNHVDAWIKDLMKNPKKSVPISLFLQTYPGIIRSILRPMRNILSEAREEVDTHLQHDPLPAPSIAPYNKFAAQNMTPVTGMPPYTAAMTSTYGTPPPHHGHSHAPSYDHHASRLPQPLGFSAHSVDASPPSATQATPAPVGVPHAWSVAIHGDGREQQVLSPLPPPALESTPDPKALVLPQASVAPPPLVIEEEPTAPRQHGMPTVSTRIFAEVSPLGVTATASAAPSAARAPASVPDAAKVESSPNSSPLSIAAAKSPDMELMTSDVIPPIHSCGEDGRSRSVCSNSGLLFDAVGVDAHGTPSSTPERSNSQIVVSVSDGRRVAASASVAARLEDNEELWNMARRELNATQRELDEVHASTAEMQEKSDALDRDLRILRSTFLPNTELGAVDAVLDFLELFLADPSSFPSDEKELSMDWWPCAAVLLQHSKSTVDRLGIHADLSDADAHLLAGLLRGSKTPIGCTCRELNLANNELHSTGAADVLQACLESTITYAEEAQKSRSSGAEPLLPLRRDPLVVNLDGNFLHSKFGPHVDAYTSILLRIEAQHKDKMKPLID